MKSIKTSQNTVITAILSLGILFIVLICSFIPDIRYYFFPKDFDSIEWTESYDRFENSDADGTLTYRELATRKEMVQSIVREKQLLGKNRQEIKNILGIDDNGYDSSVWLYWIDFTASDNKWLQVEFGSVGLVESVKIIED